MKTLYVDIETTPNLAHVWGLFDQTVSLSQLRESTRMFCFGAKWRDARSTMFFSEHKHGHEEMVHSAHALLHQADVVVHYNGTSFDIRHLNREFLLAGLTPPAPYQQIDLLRVVKKAFLFPSNKLAYVSEVLEIGGKVQHEGHTLWVKCMAGDPKAWKEMERYCKQDVDLLPELHDKLLPWITNHPNHSLYSGEPGTCPNCGSASFHREGHAYTSVGKYPRFQCNDCGRWFQGTHREDGTDVRGVA